MDDLSIPAAEPDRDVDPHASNALAARRLPADTILFPRRMLYVEAVLYLVIAATAFGLGYLIGRGGARKAPDANADDAAVANRVPVEGKVTFVPLLGAKRPDTGAVVIVLPADKSPVKPLAVAGLRALDIPAGAGDPVLHAVTDFGGAAARCDGDGGFTLFVPRSGKYRVLVISRRGTREASDQPKADEVEEIGKYFASPLDLLRSSRYQWLSWDVKSGMPRQDVKFAE